MKIDVRSLTGILSVRMTGEESWLSSLYQDFPVPKGGTQPLLTGELRVRQELSGDVLVLGQFHYEPYVDCGRCGLKIQWPLRVDFESRFRQAGAETPMHGERQLTEDEMDLSYFDAPFLDLDIALSEQVHLAIPARTTKVDLNTGSCAICGDDLSSPIVYAEKEPAAAHPFAKLTELNLDDGEND